MESKNKFWKGVLVGALVTMFAGLIVVGMSTGIWVMAQGMINEKAVEQQADKSQGPGAEENKNLDMESVQVKLGVLQNYVQKYFLFDHNVKNLEAGIYSGYLAGLDDPYSVYYTEEELLQLMEDTAGIYCGIGAMVSQNRETGVMTIFRIFEGSPSLESGMKPGDIIYKVDGMEVTGIDLDILVQQHIKGEEGTNVVITVVREGVSEPIDLTITRRQIEVPTVEHTMLEENNGYISITQFEDITPSQFIDAVEDLEKQGMERLVIDLRDNPGGVLDSAVEMLAYVLPEDKLDGMLIYTKDKYGKGDQYYCQGGKIRFKSDYGSGNKDYPRQDNHQIDIPIAVLVNGNSASASEIFAGAIKDYKWGTVVGTKTFGKGIVQNVFTLPDNTALKLTTSHYYTPSGFDLHEKGIEPDVEVELDESLRQQAVITPQEDNQLQKAIEALR